MSIRVPVSGTVSVPVSGTLRHARLPETVLHDERLSPAAKLVYAELALWVFQGRTCSIGMRKIAERLGFSKTTVADAMDSLVQLGAIQVKSGQGHGKRSVYVLTSPVFGQKQGRVTEAVSAPSGGRRYASVVVEEVA